MKLHIPSIGDKLLLTKKWTAKLIPEYRNNMFVNKMFPQYTRMWTWHPNFYDMYYGLYQDNSSQHLHPIHQTLNDRSNWIEKCVRDIYYDDIHVNFTNDINVNIKLAHQFIKENVDIGLIKSTLDYTFEESSILIVDRIYIRKGKQDYDSISFRIESIPSTKKMKGRFFVKLDNANEIEYNQI